MMYTELVIGNDSYKLRLATKNAVALEKALGHSLLDVLMKIDQNVMPTMGEVLTILHAMLQAYHHGMNMDKVYDLYDAYVEDGHNFMELIPVIVEVMQNSGYLPKADEKKAEVGEGKN